MSQSTMQFDHQGSFIKVERAPGDLLQVELQFRTLKPDVVLVYSETLSESDAQTGYIQVVKLTSTFSLQCSTSIIAVFRNIQSGKL